MKANSPKGFQNVDSTRVVFLEYNWYTKVNFKRCRLNAPIYIKGVSTNTVFAEHCVFQEPKCALRGD